MQTKRETRKKMTERPNIAETKKVPHFVLSSSENRMESTPQA